MPWSRRPPWRPGRATASPSTTRRNGSTERSTYWPTFSISNPRACALISPFLGGGFGSEGIHLAAHTVIAAMAAKAVGKTVKLVIDRSQFFTSNGHRSETEQRVRIAATPFGAISGLIHDVLDTCGNAGDSTEPCAMATPMLCTRSRTSARRITRCGSIFRRRPRCALPVKRPVCLRLIRRSTNSPTPPASTRSSCAYATTRRKIRRTVCRSQANICSSAIAKVRGCSAGTGVRPNRARCARATSSSDTAWRRRRIRRWPARPTCACVPTAAAGSPSSARRTTWAPGCT